MKFNGCILVIMILLAPCIAEADFYRYIDNKGNKRVVNRISAVPEQYRDQLKTVMKTTPDSAPSNAAAHQNKAKPGDQKSKSKKKVEIFVTSWCPHCRKLETFLKSEKIKYTSYDIEKSEEGKQLYEYLGGKGVPLTKVGSQDISGYNPTDILSALGE
jgi:glutaredoxin